MSILRRDLLGVIQDQHIDLSFPRFQFESQLRLHGAEERGAVGSERLRRSFAAHWGRRRWSAHGNGVWSPVENEVVLAFQSSSVEDGLAEKLAKRATKESMVSFDAFMRAHGTPFVVSNIVAPGGTIT